MNLTIEMHDPEATLLYELTQPGITQKSVAITYAFLIAQKENDADWPRVNRAIQERWRGRSALERVKKMAWNQVYRWAKR